MARFQVISPDALLPKTENSKLSVVALPCCKLEAECIHLILTYVLKLQSVTQPSIQQPCQCAVEQTEALWRLGSWSQAAWVQQHSIGTQV